MADYSKKTNADLVEILKSRSLPHTGKKAELVARIQQDDEQKSSAAPAATTTAAEDVIDWDDEPVEPATEAGANAIAAGGKGAVANPVAVPNQKLDTDPAATEDLKVESTGDAEKAAAEEEAKPPPVDYTRGLPASELAAELEKRKKRAEKFGIQEDAETALKEAEKSLERAKRFGAGAAEAESSASIGVKGLDEALPNEPARKRARNEQGGRGGKRRDVGRNRHGRGHGNQNRNGGGNAGPRATVKPSGVQKSWSEKDTAALEARKKRFTAA